MGRGGGGAYLKNRDQKINVSIVRYATSVAIDTRGGVANLRITKLKSRVFQWYGKRLRVLKARASRGVWGHAPQKIFKCESLKTQFPALSGR